MKMRRIIYILTVAVVSIVGTMPAWAVTEREMEEARTIAAKAYLRYANNGSGYLDDVSARTMAELEKNLKAKEKENIKAFKAIKVPGDYASWDKAKLVEFWGTKAFETAGLIAEGKGARPRVRKQINAMAISAPAPAEKPEQKTEEQKTEEPAAAAEPVADTPQPAMQQNPAPESAIAEQDILADQNAIAEDAKNRSLEKEENSTWIYVVILCVLIGVVIWLVTYAAKIMKRQGDADRERDNVRDTRAAQGMSASEREEVEETIHRLNKRLHDEQERNIETSRAAERLKLDNERLKERFDKLMAERNALEAELRDTKERLAAAMRAEKNRDVEEPRKIVEASRQQAPAPQPQKVDPEVLRVIYLGRTNSEGIFVRADRRVSPGNTVYRLDTEDGLVGTFHVVELPVVTRMVLERPVEMLSHGCVAKDLADTAGATGIVTEDSGTAIFENGYWRVLRPSRIRYE